MIRAIEDLLGEDRRSYPERALARRAAVEEFVGRVPATTMWDAKLLLNHLHYYECVRDTLGAKEVRGRDTFIMAYEATR